MKHKFYFEFTYNDGSEFGFDVIMEGSATEVIAPLNMIARGTLMASIASRVVVYNEDGFDVCSYIK